MSSQVDDEKRDEVFATGPANGVERLQASASHAGGLPGRGKLQREPANFGSRRIDRSGIDSRLPETILRATSVTNRVQRLV